MSGQEPGHYSTLVSLGGVTNTKNYGRTTTNRTVLATTNTNLLEANPRRISAIIKNIGAGTVALTFGEDSSGAILGLPIIPQQSLQIDKNFPWTGDVRGTAAVNSNCSIQEISVV